MWSPVGVPSSSDTVCITNDAASYTVTVDTSAVAGSLLVGGTAGTQTLDISAGESLQLYGDSATSPDGTITMEASSTPGASYLYLDGYTLTNAGTLDVPASDGTPAYLYYDGSVVNTGTVEVDGTLNIYGGVTFTNAVGGSVVNNGTFTDGTYVQDGGSNSGTPLSPSTLVLSGGGSASFEARGHERAGRPADGRAVHRHPRQRLHVPGQQPDQRRHHHHGHLGVGLLVSLPRGLHPHQRRDLQRPRRRQHRVLRLRLQQRLAGQHRHGAGRRHPLHLPAA